MSESTNDLFIEWIRCALEGDEAAQERLFDRISPVIHRCVAKTLRPWHEGPRRNHGSSPRSRRQEVEDLVQEVWLHLFDKDGKTLRSWDPAIAKLEAFVCTIARNRTLMSFRRRSRIDASLDEEHRPEPPSADDPERDANFRDLWRKHYLCITKKFKARDSLLFKWLIVEGLAPKEVAERLGEKVNTLHKWLSRTRRIARDCRDLIMGLVASGASR